MMKDVIISIKGTQGLYEESDTIEFTTDGRFGEKDGSYLITYDESEILGMKNVKTCLYVKPDNSVILQRSGTVQSRLVVEEGRRSTCYYCTPQGRNTSKRSSRIEMYMLYPVPRQRRNEMR